MGQMTRVIIEPRLTMALPKKATLILHLNSPSVNIRSKVHGRHDDFRIILRKGDSHNRA
jgi:hypothetical protein